MERTFEFYEKEYKRLREEDIGYGAEDESDEHIEFVKEHGFSYAECWNLDHFAAKYLFIRLAYLAENHDAFPMPIVFTTEEDAQPYADKWNDILWTMTEGFYILAVKESYQFTEEESKIVDSALSYFKEYFTALWD